MDKKEYVVKNKITLKNCSEEEALKKKRYYYYKRKKPATVEMSGMEYCSLGTIIFANAKKNQYEKYKKSDIPDKSYAKFRKQLGDYWKKLNDDEKIAFSMDENFHENIFR